MTDDRLQRIRERTHTYIKAASGNRRESKEWWINTFYDYIRSVDAILDEPSKGDTDSLAKRLDDLVEKQGRAGLRLEHYHPTMQWVAYHHRKDGSRGVEDAIKFSFPGKTAFDFLADTPEEALDILAKEMAREEKKTHSSRSSGEECVGCKYKDSLETPWEVHPNCPLHGKHRPKPSERIREKYKESFDKWARNEEGGETDFRFKAVLDFLDEELG